MDKKKIKKNTVENIMEFNKEYEENKLNKKSGKAYSISLKLVKLSK